MMNVEANLEQAYEDAVGEGRRRLATRDFEEAWSALERAHVLGQTNAWRHIRSHWWMLRIGIAEGNASEIIGQSIRLVLAGPSSIFERYPRGNNGRSSVSMFQPMPISEEIETLLGK